MICNAGFRRGSHADVGKELRKKNQTRISNKITTNGLKEFGKQKVHDQIERVISIMKLCDNMDDFKTKFARVFKKTAVSDQLNFNWVDQP
jgi:hypothetical protein